MALAGNQQHITPLKITNSAGNGLVTTGDLDRIGAGGDDRIANGASILGPRIVICHKDQISIGARNLAHHRAFAGITVTATAEQHGKPAGYFWPQRRQCRRQGIWCVRIINHDLRSIWMSGYRLHSSGCRLEEGDGVQGVLQGQAAHMTHDCRGQRVHCLKGAGQCERNVPIVIAVADRHLQHAGDRLNPDDLKIRILGKPKRYHHTRRGCVSSDHLGQFAAIGIINIDYRNTGMHQNVGEQPCLCRKIGIHIMVMVEVVTGQIGKCRDMDVQTVKPVLFQPMAARLQRQIGDAGICQHMQVAV